MTRISYRTPGTRVWWSSVEEWCTAGIKLSQRRLSHKRNRDLATHSGCMPLTMIYAETDLKVIERALHLLKFGAPPLCRPERGYRADHPSTPVIVALKNRIAVLKKEEDVIPAGDNWHKALLSNKLNVLGD